MSATPATPTTPANPGTPASPAPSTRRSDDRPSPLRGRKILLVDDDHDVLQTLQAAFEPTGCILFTSRNGNKAIEIAQREHPELIVLDMMLPGRSGFLVLEKLKADKLPSEKPYIIMLTANEGMRHQMYAEARGVNDYFHKPASLERLLTRAEEIIQENG